jgi:tRNA(Ile)-lysidine synthase
VLRPLLGTTRAEIEAYLRGLGQEWREDSTNRDVSFTRNRIRHELLPLLESWNPRLREHLAQMAELARDEEAWWQAELERLAPQMILRGRPVRGGGRAASDEVALDGPRLAALAPALQRRLLRHAAKQLGGALDFDATESLRAMTLKGRAGQKLELAGGLRAERTPREVRLALCPEPDLNDASAQAGSPEYRVEIPGEIDATAFGLKLRIEPRIAGGETTAKRSQRAENGTISWNAILRNWRPGDQVMLRYSSGPRKVKEVLERIRVTGSKRKLWPVLEVDGRIVWMRGVELEPYAGLAIKETIACEGSQGLTSGNEGASD